MEKFFNAILNKKIIVLTIFIILVIVSALMWPLVGINYNMKDYLPKTAESTKSIDKVMDEFSQAIPNLRVMIKNVTLMEALKYKEKLKNIEGVSLALFLDDIVDIKIPIETMDKSVVEAWYKDNNAVIQLTIKEANQKEAIAKINELIKDKGVISGAAVEVVSTMVNTTEEVNKIMLFVIPMIFLILIIATTAWVEPFILLITIGVAIILNMGSNIIFGEISFITQSAASLLQLAVSMDYSVFLLHRFNELRKDNDPFTSVVKATVLSFKSILSSGLTTAIGFLALILMRFEIGPDMGIVMAKGIFFSLLSVFFLLPILLLLGYKLIDKTLHKPLVPSFGFLSSIARGVKKPIIFIIFIIFIFISYTSFLAQNKNQFDYGSSKTYSKESALAKDKAMIEKTFGRDNQMVVLVKKDLAKEKQFSEKIKEIRSLKQIISYSTFVGNSLPSEFLLKEQKEIFFSKNYSRIILNFDIETEGEKVFTLIEDIRGILKDIYKEDYYLAGESVSTYDMKNITSKDNTWVNLVAIVSVGLVLLLTFKSLFIPLLLLLVIETSIWINMSLEYFSSSSVFFITFLIISSIQLGATVDYAILFSNRYIENRKDFGVNDSLTKTIKETVISILTSGIILTIAGIILQKVSSNMLISQHGKLIGRGAFLSFVLVLLILPLFIKLFDSLIEKTTLGVKFKKEEK